MKSVSKFGHCKTINQKGKKLTAEDKILLSKKKKIVDRFSEEHLKKVSDEYKNGISHTHNTSL